MSKKLIILVITLFYILSCNNIFVLAENDTQSEFVYIIQNVNESIESYDYATGEKDKILYSSGNYRVKFSEGDYQVFEVEIPLSGVYSLNVHSRTSNATAITATSLYDNATNKYSEFSRSEIISSGTTIVPTSMGNVNLEAGTHKIKIEQMYSDVYLSYITLERTGNIKPIYIIDGLNAETKTATLNESENKLRFNSANYADYKVNAESAGRFCVMACVSSDTNAELSISKDNVYLCGVKPEPFVDMSTYRKQVVGYINLQAGEQVIKLRNSGINSSYFLLDYLTIEKVGDETKVGVGDEGVILSPADCTDSEYVQIDSNGSAVISETGFLKYDLSVENSGYYKISLKADEADNSCVTFVSNEKMIGQTESLFPYSNICLVNLKDGKNRFKVIATKGQVAIDEIKIEYLPSVNDDILRLFTEKINMQKNDRGIFNVLSEYEDILSYNLEDITADIFYKTLMYSELTERDYHNAQEILVDLYSFAYKERKSPGISLYKDSQQIYKLTSGNLKVVIDTSVMQKETTVAACIYKNNQLYMVDIKSYNTEINTLEFLFNNVVINNDDNYTFKLVVVDSMQTIKPISVYDNIYKEFYLSPYGSDENDGSKNSPFLTIDRVKQAISSVNDNMNGNIIVNIKSGYYQIDNTIQLGVEHSGKNGYNVIFRGETPENPPVFSGGKRVSGWKLWQNGIYRAQIQGALDVRNLYINGYPAIRAKSEGAFCVDDLYKDENSELEFTGLITEDDCFPDNVECFDGLEAVMQNYWATQRVPVENIILNNGSATVMLNETVIARNSSEDEIRFSKNKLFYLENNIVLLDEQGEFCYDKANGYIYYYPLENEDIENAEVYVGVTQGLVNISGESVDEKATNIVFDNIDFKYGAWDYAGTYGFMGIQADWFSDVKNGGTSMLPQQICVNRADNIEIVNCKFSCLGSSAVGLIDAVSNTRIEGNVFHDISGAGIVIGTWLHETIENGEERCRNITVKNNELRRIAIEYRGCTGISIYYENNITVCHNHIKDLPYTGISVGWGWGNADPKGWGNFKICHNYIENVMQALDDGAGIYTLGHMRNCDIAYNHFDGGGIYSASVYTDSGTAYVNIHNNVTTNWRMWLFIASAQVHDVMIKNNYTNTLYSHFGSTAEFVNSENTAIKADDVPDEAQQIINSAGLETEYSHLSEEIELVPGRKCIIYDSPKTPFTTGTIYYALDSVEYTQGVVYTDHDLGFNRNSSASFDVTVSKAGRYLLRAYVGKVDTDGKMAVMIDGKQEGSGVIKPTGGLRYYKYFDIGMITLPEGTTRIALKSLIGSFHMKCFSLEYIG